jgi:hypothetical protein
VPEILKCAHPLHQLLSFDRWNHHPSPLKPVEKDLDRGGKIVQLNSGSKLSRPESQRVSFRPSPGAPFNDHSETQSEELLTKLPLETFNLLAPALIPDIPRKSIHPFVGTETRDNCPRGWMTTALLRVCSPGSSLQVTC